METTTFRFSDDPGNTAHFCGLDVHKYALAVAIYARDDSHHEFLKSETFGTDLAGLNAFWNFAAKYQPASFTMEATNVYHHVVFTFLDDMKHQAEWSYDILIVNPADAAGIPGRQKHDRLDAELLAKYTAAGLLKGGKPIITPLEDIRQVFRTAYHLEVDRTALKNRIKKTMDRGGFRPRGFNLNNEWTRDLVYQLSEHEGTIGELLEHVSDDGHPLQAQARTIKKHISEFEPYFNVTLTLGQKALIRQDLVELEFKTARKALLAVEIDALVATRPGLRQLVSLLATIPGITPYAATWLVAEVGHCSKYANVRKFLSYCGCCRKTVRSADVDHPTHINRHSNKYVRELLFNAAKVVCLIVKTDSELKRYAKRVMANKAQRSMKLAICIVSAKIARIVFSMMQSEKEFDPGVDQAKKKPRTGAGSNLTVSDKKTLRRARGYLKRVSEMREMKGIAKNAKYFADALDRALREN